ncbi:cytochrome P450 [Pendulispora albinea]|uniref:Cytochrome P450 n=2 Tax=Pendulispora albinea TaxID=2741071 RepID=A0ABZ2MCH9_9BACT
MFNPGSFLDRCHRQFGDTFTARFGSYPPSVFVSHPEDIKRVFLASSDEVSAGEANTNLMGFLFGQSSVLSLDGKSHLRARRMVMPPFHSERLRTYYGSMRARTDEAIRRWPVGRPFSMHEEMHRLTFDIILGILFGPQEREFYEPFRSLVAELVKQTESPLFHALFAMLPSEQLTAWLTRSPARVSLGPLGERDITRILPGGAILRAKHGIDAMVYGEITRRRASPYRGDDVLSTFLDAKGEDGRGMSDAELHDQLITLFIAGHDTTATALSWAFYHLLKQPGVLGKLRAEVNHVPADDEAWGHRICELPYLDAFIKETMRLTPVAPIIIRILQQPLTIGKYEIPAGSYVTPCVYLTHRRPDVWPEPERFRPERFLGTKTNPYEFFPFGGGVRRCLGASFALHEMKLLLAQVISRTELRLEPGPDEPIARKGLFLAPGRGVSVIVDGRPKRRSAGGSGDQPGAAAGT